MVVKNAGKTKHRTNIVFMRQSGKSEQYRYLLHRRRTRKKLLASRSVVSAFTSEQRRRHATFCGKGGAKLVLHKTATFFSTKRHSVRAMPFRCFCSATTMAEIPPSHNKYQPAVSVSLQHIRVHGHIPFSPNHSRWTALIPANQNIYVSLQ